MTWPRAIQLRALLTLTVIIVAMESAHAQDAPEPPAPQELREMPDTLPASPPKDTAPAGAPAPVAAESDAEPANDEPTPGLRLEAQLLFAMGLPFAGNESGAAFGFGITYGAGWGSIPILIGIDFMSVGRSNSATSRATTTGDGAAWPVTRTSSDRLLDFDLWLRVQPPRWPVRPYAEGLVGAKLVQTNWKIATRDEVTKSGGDDAWTAAYGWGIGVDFMGLFNAVSTFSLTLGMRRLQGSQVELERPIVSDGRAVVSKRQVATNETIFMAGLCGRYDFGADE